MPCAEISLILLGVLMVSIHTQRIPDDGMTLLDQTELQLGTELQTGYSLRNQGLQTPSTNTNGFQQTRFREQLQTVPLRSLRASRMSLRSISTVEPEFIRPNEGIGHDSPLRASFSRINGVSQASFLHQLQSFALQSNRTSSKSLSSIRTVDPELLGPHEGIGHYYPLQIANVFNPTLLGPNEGIGHNYPLHIANVFNPTFLGPNKGIGHNYTLQFQKVFATRTGVSLRTVSDSSRDKPQSSPFSPFGTIFPFRVPKREIFHTTENRPLPLITSDQFNRLPKLGGRGDAVVLTGGYIHSLEPGTRRRGPGLKIDYTVWPLTLTEPKRFKHLPMMSENGDAISSWRPRGG